MRRFNRFNSTQSIQFEHEVVQLQGVNADKAVNATQLASQIGGIELMTTLIIGRALSEKEVSMLRTEQFRTSLQIINIKLPS